MLSRPRLLDLPAPPPGRSGFPWTEETPPLTGQGPWPRVSVVTPSYNQGEYLEETIRSVLLQGYPDLEYFIMDGGSSDSSVEIIRRYAPWLAGWVSAPDGGQTQAINTGWARASGQILGYINSDDCYEMGAIQSVVRGFQDHPGAGMVYGTAVVVDEAGQPLRAWRGRAFDLHAMLADGNHVPQPTAFFAKAALQTAGCLDEQWHMIMDYEFCIRIGLRFSSVCLPQTLARFRDHAQSKTNRRFEATASEVLKFLATFHSDHLPAAETEQLKRRAESRVHYEWALACLAHNDPQPAFALKHLAHSIRCDPVSIFRRPAGAAYILKEAIWRSLVNR